MMLWVPLSGPASCKSVLQMTWLHPQRALFMLKPELSFSNALMKSAVFICGGSKCCDIRSICKSAQPSNAAELQAMAKEGTDHPFKPCLFFLTTNLSSSPFSVPLQLVYLRTEDLPQWDVQPKLMRYKKRHIGMMGEKERKQTFSSSHVLVCNSAPNYTCGVFKMWKQNLREGLTNVLWG